MTFAERNEMLKGIVDRCAAQHAQYTSGKHLLTDEEWSTYIHKMDEIAAEFVDTNMADFVGAICMAYLNDTELVQKKLKEVK